MAKQDKSKADGKTQRRGREEDRRRGPVYAALCMLLSLFGLSGLFLGYYTGGSPVGYALAGGAPILRGSLLGVVIEVLRGSIPMPHMETFSSLFEVFPLFLYVASIFLVASLVLSFFMTLGAIVSPRSARKFCLRVGKLILFSYFALFFGNFAFRALSLPQISAEFFDLPSLAACGLSALVLLFVSLAENGARGAINFLLLLLSLLPAAALLLPSAPLSRDVNDLIFRNGAFGGAARLALFLVFAVSIFNLFFSLLRLNVRRGYFLDFLRFSAQLACGILLLLRYATKYGSVLEFFAVQPLSGALLFLGPVLAAVCSLFAGALAGRAAKRKKTQRASESTRPKQKLPRRSADFEEQPDSVGALS